MKVLTLLSFVLISVCAFAQELSVEKIMHQHARMLQGLPENIEWSADNQGVRFDWNPGKYEIQKKHVYGLKDKEISLLTSAPEIPGANKIIYSPDRKKAIFEHNKGLYLYDEKNTRSELITQFDRSIQKIHFITPEVLGFTKDKVFHTLNLKNRELRAVARIKNSHSESKKNEQERYLIRQQEELFPVLKAKKEKREKLSNYSKQLKPEPIADIESSFESSGPMQMNAKQSHLAFIGYDYAKSNYTKVPHFVSEDGFLDIKDARPKVGTAQSRSYLQLYNIHDSTLIEMETAQLPGIKEQPAYFAADYPERVLAEDEREDRPVNVADFSWSPDGQKLLAIFMSDDNKDKWFTLVDISSGDLHTIDRQRDEAWIGGPGIGGWSFYAGQYGWMPNSEHIWFQSEASGYAHLYLVNVNTGHKEALTSGNFEVYDPMLSKDGKSFYFTANKKDPGIRHFYKLDIDDLEMTQITNMDGNNEVRLSADEKHLAIRYSSANKPWELYIQKTKAGAEAQQITQSTSEAFDAYSWRTPEYVKITAQDGQKVPARLYLPESEAGNGAAVIFVHGAGYLQNAHRWWSNYYREYMFHNLLVDEGFTVLDIDYRGSAGYGRDYRTAIYRHMGGKDLSDQVDGANFLVENHQVDAERIGIYGGSYGGFITLMALFNHPGTFKAGAALRSVTDWAHYNHGYTENILNTPALDSIAYRRSSPIYFADGLQDHLLMCHGMVDDNVQFQDIVRLTQRFIELGKEDWELAVYPVEPHGFKEATSWTDEYKRILKLFMEKLE